MERERGERQHPVKKIIEELRQQQEDQSIDTYITPPTADNISAPARDEVNKIADKAVEGYILAEFLEARKKVEEKMHGKQCNCRSCTKRVVENFNNIVDFIFSEEPGTAQTVHQHIIPDPTDSRGFTVGDTSALEEYLQSKNSRKKKRLHHPFSPTQDDDSSLV